MKIKIAIPQEPSGSKELFIDITVIKNITKNKDNTCRIETEYCSFNTASSFDDIRTQIFNFKKTLLK